MAAATKRTLQATVNKLSYTEGYYIRFYASDLKMSFANTIMERNFKTRKAAVAFLTSLGFI